VSITRPDELAKELFTHKGSGTLVRRGERVLQAATWAELDLERLRELIESAFGRSLVPDYFQRTALHRAYVSENYRAAVILTEEGGIPYLDKFAVLDEAQGEGLGRAVWQLMRDAQPRLFWRSRHGNPVNAFYDTEADGSVKQARWRAYWYGIGDLEGEGAATIMQCLRHCRERPASLSD
jgi:acetylglutamate kinase